MEPVKLEDKVPGEARNGGISLLLSLPSRSENPKGKKTEKKDKGKGANNGKSGQGILHWLQVPGFFAREKRRKVR